MPHGSLTLLPGVDTNRTPAMNEATVVDCDMIRFMSDQRGGSLIQKLGGWVKFFPSPITSVIRNLLAWEDLSANQWLAVGAEQELSVINNGMKTDITPQQLISNSSINFTTQSGSPTVEIIDSNGTVVTEYDAVYIATPVSVGGVILQGYYPTIPTRDVPYFITNLNVFGNPTPVPTSVMSGGVVPTFSTIAESSFVTVNFPNHGLSPGDTTTFLVPTTVGGIVIYGQYIVSQAPTPDVYTMIANATATSSESNYAMNADPATPTVGRVQFIYSITNSPVPMLGYYGSGIYGNGIYGIGAAEPPSTGTPIVATDWSLESFGAILLACPVNDNPPNQYTQTGGSIYSWDPANPQVGPQVITQAPAFNEVMFIAMPQLQVIALGCEPDAIAGSQLSNIQDPLLVRWSDIIDPTVWIPQLTNQAGSYRIPIGSKIIGGRQGPQQGLIWTDLSIWSMQYVNLPDVYQFSELASGCGLIGRRAHMIMDGVVFWMTQTRFMKLGPEGIQEIPCPIWDVIFQQLDFNYVNNIRMGGNSRFGEFMAFFPTIGSNGVITQYVKYNTVLHEWDFGSIPRTAWINQSIFGPPIAAFEASPTINYIYQHETTNDADGLPMTPRFLTGYYAMSEGDQKFFIDQFWPDMKWGFYNGSQNAIVRMRFHYLDYPGQLAKVSPWFVVTQTTQFVSPRIRARLVAIELESDDLGSFWRIGKNRYRYQPDGVF
jgi:hypothetical protein